MAKPVHTTSPASRFTGNVVPKAGAAPRPPVAPPPPPSDIPEGFFDGFEEVPDLSIGGFWDGKEVGEWIDGYLRGTKTKPSTLKPGTTERVFWLELAQPCTVRTKDRETDEETVYEAEPGVTVGVNARGSIESKLLPQVKLAETSRVRVRIYCLGRTIKTGAGHDMYNYKVGIRVEGSPMRAPTTTTDEIPFLWLRTSNRLQTTRLLVAKCSG